MSHMTAINLVITDLDALDAAVRELGGRVIRNAPEGTMQWYGRSVGDYELPEGFSAQQFARPEHVIQFPQFRYTVGLFKNPQCAGWVPLMDFFGDQKGGRHDGGLLAAHLGGYTAPKLKQIYGVAAATKAALARGLKVNRVTMPNGSIKLMVGGIA